ncbi:hypothetical protein [Halomonas casei]|uniref:hypothetical protein n=1 Tax=Halomonas casei TaxID=2742613 RepID=UPI003CF38E70
MWKKLFDAFIQSVCVMALALLPTIASSNDPRPADGITLLATIDRISKNNGPWVNYAHYCHMDSVYLSGSAGHIDSMALVWNHATGQPLKCTEYAEYVRSLGANETAESASQ